MNIVTKLWSYCHILRHEGLDYTDYIEQLTYLLFLKMADENGIYVPVNCQWKSMLKLEKTDLIEYYDQALDKLKEQEGILGRIFQEPISKIKNPDNLKKIIIGIEEVGWTKLGKDVQGEAFEGLLERTANEGKKGAGQFFTPKPLIQAIVNVMKPDPLEEPEYKIADVACGTAGFLTVAANWAKTNSIKKATKIQKEYIKSQAYHGQELVVRPYRLALMNMFLHDVDVKLKLGDSIYTNEVPYNSYNCILTNPPFGSRGVIGSPKHRNFPIETTNIQLNFIQHIYETLKHGGRAAIVLPDGALTDSKSKELWEYFIGNKLINIHTILRLPKGTFNPYANGVKASVVFLQKMEPVETIWIYDARTDVEDINKSTRPLQYEKHFHDFVKAYGSDPNGKSKREESEKFEKYSLEEIIERKYDLSFSKKFVPNTLEEPNYYVDKLIENFEQQIQDLYQLKSLLNNYENA